MLWRDRVRAGRVGDMASAQSAAAGATGAAATDPSADAAAAARDAGLRYATDARPGITRRRSGRGFSYRDPDGDLIRDRTVLARIRAMAIPPA